MGIPEAFLSLRAQQYAVEAFERLQFAYELARQNLGGCQQAAEQFNSGKIFLEFNKGDVTLIYYPHDNYLKGKYSEGSD